MVTMYTFMRLCNINFLTGRCPVLTDEGLSGQTTSFNNYLFHYTPNPERVDHD